MLGKSQRPPSSITKWEPKTVRAVSCFNPVMPECCLSNQPVSPRAEEQAFLVPAPPHPPRCPARPPCSLSPFSRAAASQGFTQSSETQTERAFSPKWLCCHPPASKGDKNASHQTAGTLPSPLNDQVPKTKTPIGKLFQITTLTLANVCELLSLADKGESRLGVMSLTQGHTKQSQVQAQVVCLWIQTPDQSTVTKG